MLVLPSAGSESTSRRAAMGTCQKGDLRRGSVVAAIGRKRLVGVRVSGAGKRTLSSRCVYMFFRLYCMVRVGAHHPAGSHAEITQVGSSVNSL
jgi:hypothetical protein